MDWLKKLIASILAMFGISAALSARKSNEVKKLKKVIKSNKKEEKKIEDTIKEMEKSKKSGRERDTKKFTRYLYPNRNKPRHHRNWSRFSMDGWSF